MRSETDDAGISRDRVGTLERQKKSRGIGRGSVVSLPSQSQLGFLFYRSWRR